MNPDTLVMGMLAVADFALLVHLRQRYGRHVRRERIMASLCMAVRRENGREALSTKLRYLRAS
jgi:hypothetical protein